MEGPSATTWAQTVTPEPPTLTSRHLVSRIKVPGHQQLAFRAARANPAPPVTTVTTLRLHLPPASSPPRDSLQPLARPEHPACQDKGEAAVAGAPRPRPRIPRALVQPVELVAWEAAAEPRELGARAVAHPLPFSFGPAGLRWTAVHWSRAWAVKVEMGAMAEREV